MSERENFLARWSRRKQAAVQVAEEASAQEQGEESSPAQGLRVGTEDGGSDQAATPDPSPQRGGERTEPAARSGTHSPNRAPSLDLSQLPAIESITAQTDISGFLAPGVPTELTRAALRRAWSADPRIRDFIGPSENSWDFNAPDAMGGFGPLEMTDELRRQILQMVGRSLDAPDAADPTTKADPEQPVEQRPDQSLTTDAAVPTAHGQEIAHVSQPIIEPAREAQSLGPDENDDRARPVVRRSHGGALPR
jgi:Protein of unknown function (DUF3306)